MNNDIVVLIPIYNPDIDITNEFLNKLNKHFNNIVFVNDGCDERYNDFFSKLEKNYPVIKHHINLGKGRGLKNGINYILNNYPQVKVLVTADCDGQHSVEDITKCGNIAIKYPESLIIGCRNFDQSNVPARSKFGNKLTRNILDFFVGARITDTQTGLRAMSMEVAKKLIAIPGERYEYETNVLIATKNENISVKEVEIETIYINDNGTSHFNPLKDSARIYKFFTKYFIVGFISFIIELLLLTKFLAFSSFLLSNVFYLFIVKIVSSCITYIFNKHISIILIISSFVCNSILFSLLDLSIVNFILLKILIDIIILIAGLFLNKFKVKKEVLN